MSSPSTPLNRYRKCTKTNPYQESQGEKNHSKSFFQLRLAQEDRKRSLQTLGRGLAEHPHTMAGCALGQEEISCLAEGGLNMCKVQE